MLKAFFIESFQLSHWERVERVLVVINLGNPHTLQTRWITYLPLLKTMVQTLYFGRYFSALYHLTFKMLRMVLTIQTSRAWETGIMESCPTRLPGSLSVPCQFPCGWPLTHLRYAVFHQDSHHDNPVCQATSDRLCWCHKHFGLIAQQCRHHLHLASGKFHPGSLVSLMVQGYQSNVLQVLDLASGKTYLVNIGAEVSIIKRVRTHLHCLLQMAPPFWNSAPVPAVCTLMNTS